MHETRRPPDRAAQVAQSGDHHKDQMAKANTGYEKFGAACDWLFSAARRAGNLDDTIEQLKLMIADLERKATR